MRRICSAFLCALSLAVFNTPAQADRIVWLYPGDDPETEAIEDGYEREYEHPRFEIEKFQFCPGNEQQFGLVTYPDDNGGRTTAYYVQRYSDAAQNYYYVWAPQADRGFHSGFGGCNPDGSMPE